MKVLIVDDEPLAREGLRLLLEQEPDIELVGECEDGDQALRTLSASAADLVFLDIHMPGVNGLELVRALGPARMPAVIFLTAHDAHAIEAFELHALDYLLKPVSTERFRASLQRARATLGQRQHHTQQLTALLRELHGHGAKGSGERLMIRTTGHVHFVEVSEILWIDAEGDYVSIQLAHKRHLIRETLKHMEDRLGIHGFQRIHRSTLVNLATIRELVLDERGEYEVVLQNDARLKLSRAWRDALCERLQYRAGGSYR